MFGFFYQPHRSGNALAKLAENFAARLEPEMISQMADK